MKCIHFINFGKNAPRFLPMIEMFLASKLQTLGCEQVDITTCFRGDEKTILKRIEALREPETCVILWESKSAKSHQYISNLFRFAKIVKPRLQVPLLTGGYWATSMAQFYPDLFEPFDTILKGFELNALARFLHGAKDRDLPPTFTAEGICNWNSEPLATQFLTSPEKYISNGFLAGYQTTFACPNNCCFCYNNTLRKGGAVYSERHISQVEDDLSRLKKLYRNLRAVQFKDLNFFHNSLRAMEILSLFRKFNISIGAYLDITVEDVDENIIRIVAEQGCEGLFFGLESFTPETRRKLNKPYSDKRLKHLFELGDAYQIFLTGSVLLGFPWHKVEDVRHEIHTAVEAMRRYDYLLIGFNSIRPVLGTDLQLRFFPGIHRQISFDQYLKLIAFHVEELQELIYGDSLDGINMSKLHVASVALKNLKTITNVHSPFYLTPLFKFVQRRIEQGILTGGKHFMLDRILKEEELPSLRRSLAEWCRALPGTRLQKRTIH